MKWLARWPLLNRLVLFAPFLLLCVAALPFIGRRDNAGYMPGHLMNGRLQLCVWVCFAAALLAGFACLAKALMAGRAPGLGRARAWLFAQRPAVWGRAAAASALFCLLPTLLAEDYARVLVEVTPFSLWRWLPVFLLCALLLTPLFRYASSSTACQYAIACLPAVCLPLCRWLAHYLTGARVLVVVFVLAAFSLALRAIYTKGALRRFVPSLPFAFLAAGVSAACAFLWVYNKIVYDPLNYTFGFGGFVFFLLVTLAMACTGLTLLVFLAFLQQQFSARNSFLSVQQKPLPASPSSALPRPAFSNKKLFAILFGIMAVVWLLWWWAYRPGTLSDDSVDQWMQAMGIHNLVDSHPILSTLWLWPFAHISQSPALFTFCQALLCAAVYAAILAWLNRRGVPAGACIALATAFALLPSLGVHAVTLWKDVPFCLGVLWLGFLLARLARGGALSRGFAAESAIALLVVACFRHNGIVVAGISGAVLLGLGLRRRAKQALAGVLAGLALVLFAQGPLFTLLEVPHYSMGLSSLGASTVGSAFTYGAELPEDVEREVLAAAPKEDWVERYSPYHHFGYFNYAHNTENPFFAPFQEKGSLWVVGMWLRTFANSPFVMLHERLSMSDSVLFVEEAIHPTSHNYPYHNRINANELGLAHTNNALLRFFDSVLRSDSIPALQAIFWRNGVWWIVGLWLLYFNFLQKRGRRNFYFVPMLANVATLVLAVAEQGFRYTYNVMPYILLGLLLAVLPAGFDGATKGVVKKGEAPCGTSLS